MCADEVSSLSVSSLRVADVMPDAKLKVSKTDGKYLESRLNRSSLLKNISRPRAIGSHFPEKETTVLPPP
jgi:hypothetical protein